MKEDLTSPTAEEEKVKQDLLHRSWTVVKTVAEAGDKEKFLPVAVDNLVPGRKFPFHIYLKTRIAGTSQAKYVICCTMQEAFPAALKEKLVSSGITHFYVNVQEQKAVVYYLYHNLNHFLEDDSLPPAQKVARIYDVSLMWLRESFHADPTCLKERLHMGLDFIRHLMNYIFKDPGYQDWFLDICRHDNQLYNHCLNCCVLGLAFTKYLGWPHFKMRDFGLGALMHDIGMVKVPAAVRNKVAGLSPEEEELLQRHPLTGFALLKEYSSLSRDSLAAVLQHHEHADGSGYPQGLKLAMIDPVGRVMRIVDAYETLTSPRCGRAPTEPLEALRIMNKDWMQTNLFDTSYLAKFISFLARG